MMTEILTIDGGQKDFLLRRANIKKKYFKPLTLDYSIIKSSLAEGNQNRAGLYAIV